jgi:hypothetical protein
VNIPFERPVFYVFPVQTDYSVKVTDLAASTDLPETGDPRPCRHSGAVERFIPVPLIHCRRPGADQGHISFQNIEKLRKFIKRQIADPSADPLFPFSISNLKHCNFFLEIAPLTE